ncbi:MAG: hypothetical protein IJR14_04390 [Synergistaceae bacterium]|nr:hypothetical protein [Synergistaceae bacterium]
MGSGGMFFRKGRERRIAAARRKRRYAMIGEERPPFDIQFFAFSPEAEREKIKSGWYSSKVSPQKQARHIAGTMEMERYERVTIRKKGKRPSLLFGDMGTAQEIVAKYGGTGIIKANGVGSVMNIIRADRPVGVYWHPRLRRYVQTDVAIILYTRRNAHVYPVWEGEWKEDG